MLREITKWFSQWQFMQLRNISDVANLLFRSILVVHGVVQLIQFLIDIHSVFSCL